jgi:autotransporter-associated beta strand protein
VFPQAGPLGGVTAASTGMTLTLTGSNTGANFIQAITGSNVVKTGPGTWVFGENNFAGQLRVQQGTIVAAVNAPGESGTSSSLGKQNGPNPVVGLANATGTAALLAFGAATFWAFEWEQAIAERPLAEKLLMGFFHSTTCRTAGFNTVDYAALTSETLFLAIILMAIGAGPCSTAGGFKVSTFMTLAVRSMSTVPTSMPWWALPGRESSAAMSAT